MRRLSGRCMMLWRDRGRLDKKLPPLCPLPGGCVRVGKIGRSQTGSIVCKKGKNRVSARFAGFADANPAQARLIVRLVSGRCPCFSLFCALRTSNARFTIFPPRTQPPGSGHSGGGFLSALEDIVAGWQECGGRETGGSGRVKHFVAQGGCACCAVRGDFCGEWGVMMRNGTG